MRSHNHRQFYPRRFSEWKANQKKVDITNNCNIPCIQSNTMKGVPDSLGGFGVLDSPIKISRIGPITHMKITPIEAYMGSLTANKLPEITKRGEIKPRR